MLSEGSALGCLPDVWLQVWLEQPQRALAVEEGAGAGSFLKPLGWLPVLGGGVCVLPQPLLQCRVSLEPS